MVGGGDATPEMGQRLLLFCAMSACNLLSVLHGTGLIDL